MLASSREADLLVPQQRDRSLPDALADFLSNSAARCAPSHACKATMSGPEWRKALSGPSPCSKKAPGPKGPLERRMPLVRGEASDAIKENQQGFTFSAQETPRR